MFHSSLYFALLAKLQIWQTTETYSPQTVSVTAAVVAPAVVICLNSLICYQATEISLLRKMDSDESGHSDSEFYYPEEEILNQMTPISLLPNFKRKKSKKKMLLARLGRSVWEKAVPLVLSTPRPSVFFHTDLPLGK